ncbi:Protein of unknown function DUF1772 [Penicillium cf. griseofulvum]|uniref:Uncharacterized protein n=1 Tax=Penicillium cf. griseofulvum TaxID=2972120 RepID=A0A9W9MS94_9EURO|nr:Protein of unknown function DUF1772 [Penicillium cf. griseofulvum]KAJ5440494.1 Protein of unknown function DUF1772 [Penicillium cf. griseofulvum]KAJ5448540.1 Protein of unknown function DUF1772 [Penicillium cf. griseofulvum]
MMNISLLTIPVLLDTTPEPTHLIDQWVRVYHYGHRVLPALSLTTGLLYAWTVAQKIKAGRPWRIFALAGLTTMSMLPFTWTVMLPTNSTLFATQIANHAGKVVAFDVAVNLVNKWTLLHTSRALLPLTGTMIGWFGTLRQLN